MEMRELFQEIKEIEMSEEMKNRIINNCYNEKEEKVMAKNKNRKIFRKPMVAIASMALCFCLVGITALAATGKLEGYFKDIKRWDGAVTGTSYEQATDEIKMSVNMVSNELEVTAEFKTPDKVPYMTFQTFGIEDYQIVDVSGNVIVEGGRTELVQITEGKTTIVIPITELADGKYKLVVSGFVGSSKADQPLVLSGTWEYEFER